MEGYQPSTYGESFADVYDEWYGEVIDADATVDRIEALAQGGPVLELGVGSGRIALPLAARGVAVYGIDSSPAMLARLASKAGAGEVRTILGDMAELELGDAPRFAVVLAAFNTFFNLVTEADQRQCLERATSHLADDGHLVVEGFVPNERAVTQPSDAVDIVRLTATEVLFRMSASNPATQVIKGRHLQVVDGRVRVRRWAVRWVTPAQLDEMADAVGLVLVRRDAGWTGEPFDATSAQHVSVYRHAGR